jgi:hypothetical protein
VATTMVVPATIRPIQRILAHPPMQKAHRKDHYARLVRHRTP